MGNKNIVQGLGSTLIGKKVYLFFCDDVNTKYNIFTIRESSNGLIFNVLDGVGNIVDSNGTLAQLDNSSFVHISKNDKDYYLTYKTSYNNKLCIAKSKNIIDWEKKVELDINCNGGKIVSDYSYMGSKVMFTGGDALRVYISDDYIKWKQVKQELIPLKKNAYEVVVAGVQMIEGNIFVIYANIYHRKRGHNKIIQYELFGALFSSKNPTKLLWQSKNPIYTTHNTKTIKLFGTVLLDEHLISYWTNKKGEMFLIRHFYVHKNSINTKKHKLRESAEDRKAEESFKLERSTKNPIITPREDYSWVSQAAYNPTAIEDDGTIHIIYRADGDDMESVWGYASTKDGVTIENKSKHCIYHRNSEPVRIMSGSRSIIYTSGNNGGGGAEDPRAVLIDGEVYITFTAFDGWGSVRVALTSISLEDLKNQKWNWKKTRLISPPGEINKNWVIFPEKINGKFAILHSFAPKILVDYFDSLDELDGNTFIRSNNKRPIDYSKTWDSWFRGVGPAPIKTDDGWLIIFHAMDHRNPDRYRLGALLLDLQDPTKELCRSRGPILEPEEHYENEGHKWGVIYSCGAVIKGEDLFVYYGGADKFVCVAKSPIKQFLEELKSSGKIKMVIN